MRLLYFYCDMCKKEIDHANSTETPLKLNATELAIYTTKKQQITLKYELCDTCRELLLETVLAMMKKYE